MTAAPLSRRTLLRAGACTTAASLLPSCRRGTRPFRFSGIPDADKEQLTRRYATVARYLSDALGRPVEYVHVPDYTAAVTALASHKIDAAWLGGVTSVQAEQRTPSGVHFVAARARDLAFKSYFVANRQWLESNAVPTRQDHAPQDLAALAALGPALSRGSFSFGAKSSTSGHVMPRWFLSHSDVGLTPETAFASAPLYQLKGGHSATLRAVASGAVDIGVVNFAAWESADAEIQASAPVIYVTPTYVDYCFVAHGSTDDKTLDALRTALTQPADTEVLQAFSAESFVPVRAQQWDQIRSVLTTLDQDGSLG